MRKWLLLVSLLSCFGRLDAQNTSLNLSGEWQLKAVTDNDWQSALVPGNVYLDLARNGRIPDPLIGLNGAKVKWVDSLEWQYRKVFSLTKQQLKTASILLQFEGVDTEADIFLNGKKLGKANNMFRRWEYEVKSLLSQGDNELLIHFYPVLEVAHQASQNAPLPLPGGDAPYIRKAQYQFGWDWAPRLLGCGIWKDVRLSFQTSIALDQPFVRVVQLDSNSASVRFSGTVINGSQSDWEVEVRLFDGKKWWVERQKKANSLHGVAYTQLLEIPQPQLWWPNGHGEAQLYPVEVNLYVGQQLVDQNRFKTGLRTIEWVQQPDADGASFYVKVNGKPIFVKGANWVPPDQFPARIRPQQYHKQVALAAQANLNMLRVWGGGTYADEAFLDACDSLGILVWQDFMFACALYPGDKSFLTNVYLEASQQVERMRNRASLALWCGNNEISEGWFNWGWQASLGYNSEDSLLLYRQYEKLFHETLPQLVAYGHPGAFYHPSSPSHGWGRDTAYRSGDVHYWGVWWGFEPFENYRSKTGRFVSEYGFQGLPSAETRRLMTQSLSADSAAFGLAAHQKHPVGDSTIRTYMARDYPVPDDPDKFAYVSQLLQARGMQIAMESHRFAQPYCMGSLFWQWNDCWPAISWSAIDYLAEPKAFYFQAKRSFAPSLLRIDTLDNTLVFQLVNDQLPADSEAMLQIQLGTLSGELLHDTLIRVRVKSALNQTLTRLDLDFLPKTLPKNEIYIRAKLCTDELPLGWSAPLYFVAPKNLPLQKAAIQWRFKSPTLLELSTDRLVKDLQITAPGMELDNNYFDLLPGEPVYVRFKKRHPGQKAELHFRSLADCL